MFGMRSDSECVSYTRVAMPSLLPIVLRPVLASWLNERSCRLPMSVTIAILNGVAAVLVGEADPIEVSTSAVAAIANTASAAIPVRVNFTCPPIREMVRSLNDKTTDPNPTLGRRSRHKQIIHRRFYEPLVDQLLSPISASTRSSMSTRRGFDPS